MTYACAHMAHTELCICFLRFVIYSPYGTQTKRVCVPRVLCPLHTRRVPRVFLVILPHAPFARAAHPCVRGTLFILISRGAPMFRHLLSSDWIFATSPKLYPFTTLHHLEAHKYRICCGLSDYIHPSDWAREYSPCMIPPIFKKGFVYSSVNTLFLPSCIR